MKIAVLTSIVGLDSISIQEPVYKNADYFLFTDLDVTFNGWITKKLYSSSWDDKYMSRRAAKIPKIIPHYLLPEYDFYIWHDYIHELNYDPEKLIIEFLKDHDFAMFKHPQRNSWLQELSVVYQYQIDHADLLEEQVKFYEKNKIPEFGNFFECAIFLRRNNKISNEICNLWYEQINKFSSRDQISLPFAFNKHKDVRINTIPGTCHVHTGGNAYFIQNHPPLRHIGKVN